jgi:hypothetical protein
LPRQGASATRGRPAEYHPGKKSRPYSPAIFKDAQARPFDELRHTRSTRTLRASTIGRTSVAKWWRGGGDDVGDVWRDDGVADEVGEGGADGARAAGRVGLELLLDLRRERSGDFMRDSSPCIRQPSGMALMTAAVMAGSALAMRSRSVMAAATVGPNSA